MTHIIIHTLLLSWGLTVNEMIGYIYYMPTNSILSPGFMKAVVGTRESNKQKIGGVKNCFFLRWH